MRRGSQRGDGDVAGLIALAVLGLFVYGIWTGAKMLWQDVAGSTPAHVECHGGGRELYSGLTTNGVSQTWNWGAKTLTDYPTGQKIRLDTSATCVERELSTAEVKRLQELWGKK